MADTILTVRTGVGQRSENVGISNVKWVKFPFAVSLRFP